MQRYQAISRGGAAFLLTFLHLAATPAASPQEDTLETFGETLDVVVVEVEVVVTDGRGRRVTGLDREDFRLLVDGRETTVGYFSEVRDGREVTVAEAGALSEVAPKATPAPEGSAPPAEPVVTNHLIFLDDYFAIPSYRDVVLRGIRDRLAALPPRDRVAVVAFDGEEIDVLTPWTSSREAVERALDRAEDRPAHGLHRAHERRRRGDVGPWSDWVAQEEELRRVLAAVRSALRTVPRPEGRKTLLLLGGGWPIRSLDPTTEEQFGLQRSLPTGGTQEAYFDDRAMIQSLADSANLLGYTIYPVDVQGLRSHGGGVGDAAPGTAPDSGQPPAGESPYTREIFRQGTLRGLAEATGGRALLYDQRVRALEAVVADTRTYYSLGFVPSLRGDGSSHRIRVELRRPDLQVRARGGFQDVSRAEELDLLAESALRFGGDDGGEGRPAAASESGRLIVRVGEARPRARRTMEVPLQVDIPWGEVTLVPGREGLMARLQIRVAARDRDGTISEMARVPLALAREAPPDPESILRWEADLTLRRERNDLVVSLYDALSGQVFTRRVSVEP